ncbi:hypothetical protein POTOM_028512 [Populus tomentosa]|uniref:Uncharacterized protein n=1 Tax=Populus tomentosa TaxID=118781 RepID=A0A8X8CVV1_POPTO|nr:hypothetical protein POTOM_028512 [Populus tomentosa]
MALYYSLVDISLFSRKEKKEGPSKRVQSSNLSKSTRQNHGKLDGRLVEQVQVEPRVPRSYAIPAAILGFAGLAAFVHYNDERRAVPKGFLSCVTQNVALCNLTLLHLLSGWLHLGMECMEDGILSLCSVISMTRDLVTILLTTVCQGSDRGNVKGPTIGGPFTLINTEDKVVTGKDFLGNWVLLYFGYTSSPDVGPEQLKVMAKAINTLESKANLKVLPVFVTLDPQRDNTSHLRAYLKEFEPRIVGLTGSVGAIRQMAQEYRVYFRKIEEEGEDYLVESSHDMYLINPNMEVVRCFGVEYNAEELSEAIQKELKGTSA